MTDLPEGWTRWSEGERKLVWAYRPDVFDGGAFPPPCLPTLYVTRGKRSRRPGAERNDDPDTPWYVTLFLEPEVSGDEREYPDREAAVAGATHLARAFAAGEVDYRGLYQVPREEYFARLDELTGR
ncbi:DUF5820 family protein [Halosegnis marinus]|uniref:DUF5820 family protein n=1 Tax=Halosegnis marinus TaxID=3034023 RepID=A0ABD5ZSU4_9EURY|nr:DUF5820 family protein [Halosegnis sp. DT85]